MTGEPVSQPESPRRPDLSVCIVSYRCREALGACLAALGAGAGSADDSVETIVIDNASCDGTEAKLAARFPSVVRRILPRNLGFAAAANRALELARGRYLLLLNPDVRVDPVTLRRAVELMEREPEWGALGIRLRYPDGRVQGSCGHFPDPFALAARSLGIHELLRRMPRFRDRENLSYFCFPTSIHEVDGIVGAFLLFRREVYERVGPLDEQYFLYAEDLDWCRRARAAGVRLVFHPGLEATHAQGSSAAREPLRSLRHFHRSSVRYHRIHEAPALPALLRPIARLSLAVRFGLAVVRHLSGLAPAQRTYLVLRGIGPDAIRRSGPPVSASRG